MKVPFNGNILKVLLLFLTLLVISEALFKITTQDDCIYCQDVLRSLYCRVDGNYGWCCNKALDKFMDHC